MDGQRRSTFGDCLCAPRISIRWNLIGDFGSARVGTCQCARSTVARGPDIANHGHDARIVSACGQWSRDLVGFELGSWVLDRFIFYGDARGDLYVGRWVDHQLVIENRVILGFFASTYLDTPNPFSSNVLMPTYVLSVGGSMIVPGTDIDTKFLKGFRTLIEKRIIQGDKFVIIAGGGGTSRGYQRAAEKVTTLTRDDVDWLGIHATRLNAHLLRTIFRDVARPTIQKNPNTIHLGKHKLVIAAGWKPGRSTDDGAVRIAKQLNAKMVINVSNIDYVYDKDPRTHKDAVKIKEMRWEEFRKLVGSTWDPGMNVPFDPVASKLAHASRIPVVIANGGKLKNLEKIFDGKPFVGTTIN